MERGEKTQPLAIELRRAARDVGAGTVPGFDHAHRRQRAQRATNGGTADAQLRDQVTLGRKTVAGSQMAAGDEVADV